VGGLGSRAGLRRCFCIPGGCARVDDVTFSGVIYNSEQFNTAGRSISTGLLAVDLVSHWTWASILLQSVSYGQFYGITGNYWYAVNDVVVMWLFAVVALELKHRAPKAHTMLARTRPLT